MRPATDRFWRHYLDSADAIAGAERWLFDVRRFGVDEHGADDLALLVSRGIKTACCELQWAYAARHTPVPQTGALSIIENGRDQPVCLVQITELVVRPFREVDQRFAYDNAEWDRSLKTWRIEYWQRFSDACAAIGREADHRMPLVCQRFRVLCQA